MYVTFSVGTDLLIMIAGFACPRMSLYYNYNRAVVNKAGSHTFVKNSQMCDHCTFFGNSAGRGGGLQVYRGGNAIVSNSLFWGNDPEQLALSSVYDSLPCKLTLNYNDIQYGLDSIKITNTVSAVVFGEGNPRPNPSESTSDMGAYENLNAWPVGIQKYLGVSLKDVGIHCYPNPLRHSVNLEFNNYEIV
jgi:hypothetical protein